MIAQAATEGSALLKLLYISLIAGVAGAVVFSLAVYGATRAGDMRRAGRGTGPAATPCSARWRSCSAWRSWSSDWCSWPTRADAAGPDHAGGAAPPRARQAPAIPAPASSAMAPMAIRAWRTVAALAPPPARRQRGAHGQRMAACRRQPLHRGDGGGSERVGAPDPVPRPASGAAAANVPRGRGRSRRGMTTRRAVTGPATSAERKRAYCSGLPNRRGRCRGRCGRRSPPPGSDTRGRPRRPSPRTGGSGPVGDAAVAEEHGLPEQHVAGRIAVGACPDGASGGQREDEQRRSGGAPRHPRSVTCWP